MHSTIYCTILLFTLYSSNAFSGHASIIAKTATKGQHDHQANRPSAEQGGPGAKASPVLGVHGTHPGARAGAHASERAAATPPVEGAAAEQKPSHTASGSWGHGATHKTAPTPEAPAQTETETTTTSASIDSATAA